MSGIIYPHSPDGAVIGDPETRLPVIVVSKDVKPTDTAVGYAPGCIWIDTTTPLVSINLGDETSSNFDDVTTS
jgi:hypothetical protein